MVSGGGPKFAVYHPSWIRQFRPSYEQAPMHDAHEFKDEARGLNKSDTPDNAAEVEVAIRNLQVGVYDEQPQHAGSAGDVDEEDCPKIRIVSYYLPSCDWFSHWCAPAPGSASPPRTPRRRSGSPRIPAS
eukprot:8923527-Pyramimonas_sp.AAC.1